MLYTYGTILKPSYTFRTTVLDVWWDQDNSNEKDRQNGAIQCNSGQSKKLENKKSGTASIGTV